MGDLEQEGFKPPYMSFQTFWTYIADLGSRPLPPTIDRSMMTGKSGTDQANLLMTLRSFELIDATGHVQPSLLELTSANQERRKEMLAAYIADHYAEPMRISAVNGTDLQLQEAFKSYYGLDAADTRRKCITFFVHAAKEAGVALSPNFKATRASAPRGSAAARKTASRKSKGANGVTSAPAPAGGAGEVVHVSLGKAGSVTVTVDVKWLQLDDDTFTALRKAINDLEGLAVSSLPHASPVTDAGDIGNPEGSEE